MRILMAATALLAAPAVAHDFWVQPARFNVAPGTAAPLILQVGHAKDRQRWGGAANRIVRFAVVDARGSRDVRSALTLGGETADATLEFAQAGTQIVVLATGPTASDLPALRFNDYVRTEGLTPALQARAASGRGDTNGREVYSRRAKALVQVGERRDDAVATRPVGLTLEIVPQVNPYALAPGAVLPVRILYEGKPLGGATVKLNNLDFDVKPIAVKLTDAAGRAAFEVPRQGRWQLNVVWTRAIAGNPNADFDTVFSSLTFGFDRPR